MHFFKANSDDLRNIGEITLFYAPNWRKKDPVPPVGRSINNNCRTFLRILPKEFA
jgi:hypothetical protein